MVKSNSKYINGLNVDLSIWNVAMVTAIANELAEANRLKRIELGTFVKDEA